MLSIRFMKRGKKSRKYPIKRDEFGESARSRAFAAFDRGLRPAEVARTVDISLRTACRYFTDWKKLPKDLESRYQMAKALLKSDSGLSRDVITMVAVAMDMPEKEVEARLQEPWGLRQILTGLQLRHPERRTNTGPKTRIEAAVAIIAALELCDIPPQEVKAKLESLIDEASSRRLNSLTEK
jgi:hypothetical protein